jgi:probable rRNA maturation factor
VHIVDVTISDDIAEALEAVVKSSDLHADLQSLLARAGLVQCELSVSFVGDDAIRDLNATWRHKDYATDVLSFPQQAPPVSGGVLGDIVVSVPTAARQADAVGHGLLSELRVLLVHGLCHLMGHDHQDASDAARMAKSERHLLEGLFSADVAAGLVERAAS